MERLSDFRVSRNPQEYQETPAPICGIGRAGTWDLTEHGLPYALAVGPYGALLALTWQRTSGAVNLVHLDHQRPGASRLMSPGPCYTAPALVTVTASGQRGVQTAQGGKGCSSA